MSIIQTSQVDISVVAFGVSTHVIVSGLDISTIYKATAANIRVTYLDTTVIYRFPSKTVSSTQFDITAVVRIEPVPIDYWEPLYIYEGGVPVEPFLFPVGSLGGTIDYAAVNLDGQVIRQGRLQINYKSGENKADCIDECDIDRPVDADPFLPEYNASTVARTIKFRARPKNDGLLVEYKNFTTRPVRLRFKSNLRYLVSGRSITGALRSEIFITSTIRDLIQEAYDYKFVFSNLPLMTDADTFDQGNLHGNIEFNALRSSDNTPTTFEISSNLRPSGIGFNAWNIWLTDPTNTYQYRWYRADDRTGTLLLRMIGNNDIVKESIGLGICGNFVLGGENCDCQYFSFNGSDVPETFGNVVRNSSHATDAIHGIPDGWGSRLFFFEAQ